jgi:hypothetical protein
MSNSQADHIPFRQKWDRVLLVRSDEQPPADFKFVTVNTAITTQATVARVTKMRRFNSRAS